MSTLGGLLGNKPTTADLIRELQAKVAALEEQQAAVDGAIRAFIVVFGVRRLPDEPGEGGGT